MYHIEEEQQVEDIECGKAQNIEENQLAKSEQYSESVSYTSETKKQEPRQLFVDLPCSQPLEKETPTVKRVDMDIESVQETTSPESMSSESRNDNIENTVTKGRVKNKPYSPLFFMINTIFWNIRGVRTKKAIHKLKYLINNNKIVFVAIMEHFASENNIEGYRKFLKFQHRAANLNGQILYFWNSQCDPIIVANDEQQITLHIKESMHDKGFYVTAVYAKCTTVDKKDLWSSIDNINMIIDGSWCVGGDFNVIMDPDERLGGRPQRAHMSFDFVTIMETCGLDDIGFTGPKFTW